MTFNTRRILKILGFSLHEAFKWKIWKWLITGSIGALSGTLQFGEKFFELDILTSAIYAGVSLMALFLIRFILIVVKESLKYFHEVYQNSSYGDTIILLKDSFALSHRYRKSLGHNDTEFVKIMMLFCNNLKEIYDKLTKAECSVSIKVPLNDETVTEIAVLGNLTRDIKHGNRDTDKYKSIKHTIIGNTAFAYSLNKVMQNDKERHYINNRINETENYQNTSKLCYDNGALPYHSELVIPIVPLFMEDGKNHHCRGFICVDSEKKDAFTSKYHVAILEGVADGLYDIISERNKFINNKPPHE